MPCRLAKRQSMWLFSSRQGSPPSGDVRAQFSKLSERSLKAERDRLGLPIVPNQGKAALVEQLAQHSEAETSKHVIDSTSSSPGVMAQQRVPRLSTGDNSQELPGGHKSMPPRVREGKHSPRASRGASTCSPERGSGHSPMRANSTCSSPEKMKEAPGDSGSFTRRGGGTTPRTNEHRSTVALNLAAMQRQRQAAERRRLIDEKAAAERERDVALAALREAKAELSSTERNQPHSDLPARQPSSSGAGGGQPSARTSRSALALLTARDPPPPKAEPSTPRPATSRLATARAMTPRTARPEPQAPEPVDPSMQQPQSKKAIELLAKLEQADPRARKEAIAGASQLGTHNPSELHADLATAIVRVAHEDEDDDVRLEAAGALSCFTPVTLKAMLRHADEMACEAAVTVLGQIAEAHPSALTAQGLPVAAFAPEVVGAVQMCFGADDQDQHRMHSAAMGVLSKLEPDALAVHARHLAAALHSSSRVVRETAVEALGKLPQQRGSGWTTLDEHARRVIHVLDTDPDGAVRLKAARTLGRLGVLAPESIAHDAAGALVRRLQDDQRKVRIAVVKALGSLDSGALHAEAPALMATLDHPDAEVRLATLETLTKLASEVLAGHAPKFASLANRDPDPGVRFRSQEVLKRSQVQQLIVNALGSREKSPPAQSRLVSKHAVDRYQALRPDSASPSIPGRATPASAGREQAPDSPHALQENPALAWTSRVPMQTYRELQASLPLSNRKNAKEIAEGKAAEQAAAARFAKSLTLKSLEAVPVVQGPTAHRGGGTNRKWDA